MLAAAALIALVAGPGCGGSTAPDNLMLSVTSDPAPGGAPLDDLRVLFSAGGVRFPADIDDRSAHVPLSGLLDPVVGPVVLSVPYGGATFPSGKVTLQVTGFAGESAATQYEGEIDLTQHAIIKVHLSAIGSACDEDGDGFMDCSVPGCCADGSQGLSDCEPKVASANPWGVEDACEPCDDLIDQDCDGTDQPCVDDDGDGVQDCKEQACGLGDNTVAPGLPELCDGKDNDCDGETDEDFALLQQGESIPVGGTCGLGECKDGEVVCVALDEVGCSTDDQAALIEDCDDDKDNNCNGQVNEGCTPDDADGDGFSPSAGDCNDADSGYYPGAEEPCCPPAMVDDPVTKAVCDRNCDGTVQACAADDADGDGYPAGDDCDDTDPQVHPNAPERCGDGIDQDCFAADLPCDDVVDQDGDGWSPPDDCDDTNPDINPNALEHCDGVDNDCDGAVDDGNPDTFGGEACGNHLGTCEQGHKVCVNTAVFSGQVLCVGGVGPAADICDGLDNDCDGETDEDFRAGGAISMTDLDGTVKHLGDACGVGACAGGTVVCGEGGAELVCDSHGLADVDVCDGVDNDCDGETDEDFVAGGAVTYTDLDGTAGLSLGDACGAGVCAGGEVVCAEDKATLTCSTVDQASADVCDNQDNDCDGAVDEDYIPGGSVTYTDMNGTAGLAKGQACGVGACADGQVVCAPDTISLTCTTAVLAGPDVCDGADNDCDGDTDEDFVTGGKVSYDDPSGATGLVKGDGCGVGACAGGTVTCTPDGTGLTCTTAASMSADICDGVDNDCDGVTDEDFIAGGTVTFTTPDGQSGLVKGADCGVGACAGGKVVCSSDGTALTCSTFGALAADKCDGVDNDCDGVTDEDFIDGGSVTYTDLSGATGLVKGDTCGVGVCGGGTVVCDPSGSQLTCTTRDQASADLCDGLDNDCDGETDEDFVAGGTVTYSGPDGTEGLVKGQPCGTGACANGTVVCGADEVTLVCSTDGNIAADKCDGVDNDCDGVTDEDFIENGSIKYTDLDGTTGLVKGDICGVGACAGGHVVCTSNGEALTCNTATSATQDVCDGVDNDCDGVTDEAFIQGGTVTYNDLDGRTGLVKGDDCGVGACAGGTVVCASPTTLGCSKANVASDEQCDAVDNDCDGETDETWGPSGSVTYTDWDGSARTLGQSCGAGVCTGGTVVCSSSTPNQLTCSTASGSTQGYVANETSPADCDGLDNDCDGVVDETCHCTYQDNSEGVCAQATIGASAPGVCTPPSTYHATESSTAHCDSLDNDCDGVTDEGCACDFNGLAVGVCAGSTRSTTDGHCLTPSAFEVSESTCGDGLDNDCDGVTDEGCACDYQGNGNGVCATATRSADNGSCMEPSTYQGTETDCDDLDNDCDGVTDEGCPCDFNGDADGVCGTAVQSASDETCVQPAGYYASEANGNHCDDLDNDCDGVTDEGCSCFYLADTDGVCATATINNAGACAAPSGYHAPESTLYCDGVDNDCDGVTDEGCACDFNDLNAGVCAGSTRSTADGHCLQPTYYEATETSCDSRDNDCDGVTDEGCQCNYKNDTDGVCANGTRSATDGTCLAPATYQAATNAESACDGLDNDCDGYTDEGCGCLYGSDPDGVCATATRSATGVCQTPTGYQADETGGNYCDGLDNDCDGAVDEGCPCHYNGDTDGVCATATVNVSGVCATPSNYQSPTAHETLDTDGLDNDCDGYTDEGGPCQYQDDADGVCASATRNSTGVCLAPSGFQATETTCDSLDNDCDGVTDEGCTCAYTGSSVGECAKGTLSAADGTCTPPATWEATEDRCDGLDNDCDGDTDLGCPCDYLSNTKGVCGTATMDATGACAAPKGYQATETTCDNLDNDCDGYTDEGCPCDYQDDPDGVCAGSTRDATGVCQAPSGFEATETTCDKADNDCDGVVDEGCQCNFGGSSAGVCADGSISPATGNCTAPATYEAATATEASCDTLDNDCDGATDEGCPCDYNGTAVGICGTATVSATGVCTAPAGYEAATADESANAHCDDVDNDCDGYTDEGCACYYNDDPYGVCLTATRDASGTCTAPTGYEATETTCDGQDNDCDGVTDEGCQCNSHGLAAGVCLNGGTVSATDGSCSVPASYETNETTCDDSADNDCDGITDEGCTCTYAHNSNVGECTKGTISPASGDCAPPSTYQLTETLCDGLDNDCDGSTDEGALDYSTACPTTQGVCADGVTATCQGAGGWWCDYTNVTWEADAETGMNLCDGLDNNCDGSTDETCDLIDSGAGTCVSGNTGDPSICQGCTADTDCATSGWTCFAGNNNNVCVLNCTNTYECQDAFGSTSWECIGTAPNQHCAKACLGQADCGWNGWSCTSNYCVP